MSQKQVSKVNVLIVYTFKFNKRQYELQLHLIKSMFYIYFSILFYSIHQAHSSVSKCFSFFWPGVLV